MIIAHRYHDISCGHRVFNHESKCSNLHGHNYRIHFFISSKEDQLDQIGRVIDFSVIKDKLCSWLENNFDHKFIIYEKDPLANKLKEIDNSVVIVPFNPTAENIAKYLVEVIAPIQLKYTNVKLVKCIVEETYKCSASFSLEKNYD